MSDSPLQDTFQELCCLPDYRYIARACSPKKVMLTRICSQDRAKISVLLPAEPSIRKLLNQHTTAIKQIQTDLAKTQSNLAKTQGNLTRTQSNLTGAQATLRTTQTELAKSRAEVSELRTDQKQTNTIMEVNYLSTSTNEFDLKFRRNCLIERNMKTAYASQLSRRT